MITGLGVEEKNVKAQLFAALQTELPQDGNWVRDNETHSSDSKGLCSQAGNKRRVNCWRAAGRRSKPFTSGLLSRCETDRGPRTALWTGQGFVKQHGVE